MQLRGFSDAIWCKMFATTLKGIMGTWFNQLPMESINSFEQLVEFFMSHFIVSKPTEKSASYLCTMKQKATKPLHEYVARFHKTCLEIPNLNEGLAIDAIK